MKRPRDSIDDDDDDVSKLFQAVTKGDYSRVQELLRNSNAVHNNNNNDNIIVNVRNIEGKTPIHLACWKGDNNLEITKLLIEYDGADLYAKDDDAKTPLHTACENGHLETVKLLLLSLIEKDDDKNGSAAVLNNILNDKDNDGMTPFQWACEKGHLEIIQLLIENGRGGGAINLNVRYDGGMTPLHWSCDYPRHEVSRLLIENGADVNAKDYAGNTPLHFACRHNNDTTSNRLDEMLEIITMLIDHGADIDAKEDDDNGGKTPLHQACWKGNQEVVQLLASRGANINISTTTTTTTTTTAQPQRSNIITPLQIACERNHLNIVWFLVRHYPWLVCGSAM